MKSIGRYKDDHVICSDLDPIHDVLTLIQYLSSTQYVLDVMTRYHGVAKGTGKERAKEIVSHVKTALDLIDLSLTGSTEVSFLPAYYAILDFMKIYILLGPFHNELARNRHHGAVYKGYSKKSQSVLTESIEVKKGGALPLFYKTITGQALVKQQTIKMGEVYPYIRNIGIEYELATGRHPQLAAISLDVITNPKNGKDVPRAKVQTLDKSTTVGKSKLKVLKNFQRRNKNEFLGDPIRPLKARLVGDLSQSEDEIRRQLRTYLIYQPHSDFLLTPVSGKQLLLPEELPIALLFFHMSSVVRYKPEFLARIRDSRFWPVLASASRHALLTFMILFWSYVHQKDLIIQHGSAFRD